MLDYAANLIATVERASADLASRPPELARTRPGEGKWSPQEIVGHLVDSATQNLQRFVKARWQDDLVFPGYDQVAWVTAQNYQAGDWRELLALWRALNLQIARVMDDTPASLRMRESPRHNLDRIAWQTVPSGDATTLDYLMRDYVGHLDHHLRQIATMFSSTGRSR
jgi:hypothetical protein